MGRIRLRSELFTRNRATNALPKRHHVWMRISQLHPLVVPYGVVLRQVRQTLNGLVRRVGLIARPINYVTGKMCVQRVALL